LDTVIYESSFAVKRFVSTLWAWRHSACPV